LGLDFLFVFSYNLDSSIPVGWLVVGISPEERGVSHHNEAGLGLTKDCCLEQQQTTITRDQKRFCIFPLNSPKFF
jgi:hypothetical protein